MIVSVPGAERAKIEGAKKEIVLGIILADGQVRLQVSDARVHPGHVEWLARESWRNVVRGFSLLVEDGKVTALFPRSRLNPGADARLEGEYAESVLRQLPTIETVTLLE